MGTRYSYFELNEFVISKNWSSCIIWLVSLNPICCKNQHILTKIELLYACFQIVTCASVPLKSSFQKVSRCVYTSCGLYEYRNLNSNTTIPNHKMFTWGLRYMEVCGSALTLICFYRCNTWIFTYMYIKKQDFLASSLRRHINPS